MRPSVVVPIVSVPTRIGFSLHQFTYSSNFSWSCFGVYLSDLPIFGKFTGGYAFSIIAGNFYRVGGILSSFSFIFLFLSFGYLLLHKYREGAFFLCLYFSFSSLSVSKVLSAPIHLQLDFGDALGISGFGDIDAVLRRPFLESVNGVAHFLFAQIGGGAED